MVESRISAQRKQGTIVTDTSAGWISNFYLFFKSQTVYDSVIKSVSLAEIKVKKDCLWKQRTLKITRKLEYNLSIRLHLQYKFQHSCSVQTCKYFQIVLLQDGTVRRPHCTWHQRDIISVVKVNRRISAFTMTPELHSRRFRLVK